MALNELNKFPSKELLDWRNNKRSLEVTRARRLLFGTLLVAPVVGGLVLILLLLFVFPGVQYQGPSPPITTAISTLLGTSFVVLIFVVNSILASVNSARGWYYESSRNYYDSLLARNLEKKSTNKDHANLIESRLEVKRVEIDWFYKEIEALRALFLFYRPIGVASIISFGIALSGALIPVTSLPSFLGGWYVGILLILGVSLGVLFLGSVVFRHLYYSTITRSDRAVI